MAIISKDLNTAKHFLETNNVIGIPTETVYGLAANAFNEEVVAKIIKAKNRPNFDPLIVHTHHIDELKNFTHSIHPKLLQLAKAFWPGPLTLLLPKNNTIPDIVTSGLDRVGVRIPNHKLTLELLKSLNFPLAAPSANPFGYISPTSAEHVEKQLGDKIPFILDGGNCSIGLESTIVGEENNEIKIYRLGGLSIDEIEKEIGPVTIELNQSSNPKAPGQLKSHYAPKVPLIVGNIDELVKQHANKKIGILAFGKYDSINTKTTIKNLSESENLNEAAINLFKYLRELDEMPLDIIITSYLPNKNLGLAINDRLKRAGGI